MEIEELRAALARAEARADREAARADALQRQVDHLSRLLERLMKHFGVPLPEGEPAPPPAPGAAAVPSGAEPTPPPPTGKKGARPARREGHGRSELPADIPRDDREYRPAACPHCASGDLRDLGQETTDYLDYVPSYLRVRRVIRWKCACRRCNAIVTAPAPPMPIDKGRCTAALLAWVVFSKYGNHVPLERMKADFRRQRVAIQVSTLCGWVEQAAFLLDPLVRRLVELLFAEGVLHTDGTGLQVLRRGQDRAHIGQIAVYCSKRLAIYAYTPTKEGKHAAAFLDRFEGTVVADAASTFDQLYATGRILEAGCWAHARRKFEEVVDHDPAAAHEAMDWISAMYDVERDARQAGIEEQALLDLRRTRTAPIAEDFRRWLDERAGIALPKSSIGKAIAYCRRHWTALTRFLEDPRLPLDNNLAERCLRAVAIGRNNYMFAGSDDGAVRAAVLYSVIQTCKLNGVDPLAWLTDVLERLSVHPDNRMRGGAGLDSLLPHNWKQPA
jgi:transposase